MRAGLMTVVLMSILGCAGQDLPTELLLNEQDSSQIIGGVEVRDDDPIAESVVSVYNTRRGGLCTGSLLTASLVVTAAHCLERGEPRDLVVVFERDITQRQLTIRPVVAFAAHPEWERRKDESLDTGDISLVRFSGGLPQGYRPTTLINSMDGIQNGSVTTLAGYGISNGAKRTGAGLLRKVDVRILQARWGRTEMLVDQTKGKGACQGDSGGPAFVRTANGDRLLGITSRGVNDPKNTCRVYAAYTNVLAHKKWILVAAKQLMSQRVDSRAGTTTARRPTIPGPLVVL